MDSEKVKNNALLVVGLISLTFIALSFVPAKWLNIDTGDTYIKSKTDENKNDLSVVQKQLQEGYLNQQVDNTTGLKNWEKLLGKTKQVDNTIQVVTKATSTKSGSYDALSDPDNITAQFAKNAYTMSAYLKQQGVTDDASIAQISKSVIEGELSKMTMQRYEKTDLKIVGTNDSKALKVYANQLVTYMNTSFKTDITVRDMDALSIYYTKGDTQELQKIQTDLKILKTFQSNVLKMSVPSSLVTYQLTLLNNTGAYINILNNILKAESDPLRALIAYKAYPAVATNFLGSLAGLKNVYNDKGVVFTPNEPAYVLSVNVINNKI